MAGEASRPELNCSGLAFEAPEGKIKGSRSEILELLGYLMIGSRSEALDVLGCLMIGLWF